MGEEFIEKGSSFPAVPGYEFRIIWRNHHTRVPADMTGEFLIGFIIDRKFLPAGLPEDTNRFFRFSVEFALSFHPETITALFHIIAVLPGKIAFGKTQIMDGIQQIGLTHAIIAINAYHPLPEGKTAVLVVFELKN